MACLNQLSFDSSFNQTTNLFHLWRWSSPPEWCGRKVHFNINTEVWDTLPLMPRTRKTCCAVMIGKKIYLLGGKYQTAVDVFDLNSMAWNNDEMAAAQFRLATILAIGEHNDGGIFLNSTELLNTESNKWTTLPSCMASRH